MSHEAKAVVVNVTIFILKKYNIFNVNYLTTWLAARVLRSENSLVGAMNNPYFIFLGEKLA